MAVLSLHNTITHSVICTANKGHNPRQFGVTGLQWSDTLSYKHPITPSKECMVLLYSYQITFENLCLTLGNWLLAKTSWCLLEVVVSRFV